MLFPRTRAARTWIPAVTLVVAVVVAYAASLRGEFLWDDDLHITANPTIVGPLGLKEIWTSARANYFPLVLTNFKLQHAAWGLDPFGYRIVTLGFHLTAALLLWRVLRQLRVAGAWIGAALWALHPVQVESVAWICELKNTQSAVFFLLAISCHLRWLDARSRPVASAPSPRRWYVGALVAAVLAILSKPSTVMLPLALGLCTWWTQRRLDRRDVVALMPFFLLSAVAAGWTIWEQKFHSGAVGPEWSQTPAERIAIAGRVVWFYLGKLVWPEPLMFIYPRWAVDAAHPLTYVGTITAAVGGLLLWWKRHAVRPAAFAAAYFVALLFPVLGFFSVYFFRYSFVGDHFQYLASMGPLAFVGGVLARLPRRAGVPAGAAILLVLGLLTARQGRVYLSNEALWRDTIAHNPTAVMAWLNLADTLTQAQRYPEAIATFEHALSLRPDDPYGHNDLGNVLVIVGRAEEAVPHFERALALKPDFPDALSNYGNALRNLGRSGEAIAKFRRALELKPDHPGALNNLGAELASSGHAAEAMPFFERALRLKPNDAALRDNLAGALRALGRFDPARAEHEAAVKLNPASAEAHANFGRTLFAAGRVSEALERFERALELKPALTAARGHYATALAAAGRRSDAFAQLERAVELAPASAEAHLNLGAALAQSGRVEEAMAHFEKAAELSPDFAPAHQNLATAYFAQRRWSAAIRHLEIAARLQPESASTRAQLAVARVNNEQLAAAVSDFEAALRLDPENAETHDNFGQLLNALGRKREAFEHLEEAARLRRRPSR